MTRTGDLRYRVSLQKAATGSDDDGYATSTWTTFATVWASRTVTVSAWQQDAMTAGAVAVEKFETITIRYRTDVDTTNRVWIDGAQYRVTAAQDADGTRRYLTMICERVMAG